MRDIKDLCARIEDELSKIADNGLTTGNLEMTYKLIDMYKDIKNTQETQMSSRFVQKENTLECQSIQIKYDFLQPWVKKHLGTQYLSLSFNTDNLFRVSSIKQERGIAYPFSRRFTFSLSATF